MKIVIDDIINLVKKLKEKIKKHEDKLSKNEALVRYALIDPFLRALGWDTENPDQVIPEFTTEVGRPDYALQGKDNNVIAFLGAKKLGKSEDLNQYITYCVNQGVGFFIVTDGQKWEVYDMFKTVKLTERKIAEWDIVNDEAEKIAIVSLTIAKLGTFGGSPVAPIGLLPVTSIDVEIKSNDGLRFMDKIEEAKDETRTPPHREPRRRRKRAPKMKPAQLIINGEIIPIDKSRQILIETAEWLISKGKITPFTISIPLPKDGWLIDSKKTHSNGKSFFRPHQLSNGLYIETTFSSRDAVRLAKWLMKYFGYPENSILVRWKE